MKKLYVLSLTAVMSLSSCSDYLDVIPGDITTIDTTFNNHVSAKKYSSTCYNFLPFVYDTRNNAAIMSGNDVCPYQMKFTGWWDLTNAWELARGG